MNRLANKLMILVMLLVLVGGLGVFLPLNSGNETQAIIAVAEATTRSTTTENGEPQAVEGRVPLFIYTNYLDLMGEGVGTGDQILPVTWPTTTGEEISLFPSQKKVLLTYGTAGCESCHEFYPILKDWAERYQDQLEVVVVFRGPAPTKEVVPLMEAGIRVIPDETLVKEAIDPGNTYENLLIDELGRVQYRFRFNASRWQRFDQLMVSWMAKGIVADEYQWDEYAIGKPLMWSSFTDATGQQVNLEQWSGQPVILFLEEPNNMLCKLTYPFLREMDEKYGDQVEMAVIFNYSDPERQQRIREYYHHFGVEDRPISTTGPLGADEILTQVGGQLPVYFDQTGEFFEYTRAEVLPAIVILDQELNLVNMYGFTTSDCCGFIGEKADVIMENVVKELGK